MFKGYGGFQVFWIASGADRYWIVSDVIIINGSGRFRELRVCPLSPVGGHLQNGRAGVGGGGGDEIAQVIYGAGQAGPVERVADIHFVLPAHDGRACGAIDADAGVQTPEKVVGRECDVISNVRVAIAHAAGRRALKAHANVMKDFGAAIDERAGHAVVAQTVERSE